VSNNQIMVSIHCLAYNHEKYISDALDSFIMQKTSFAFEVLIHDDASTDGTAEIIREYEKKYPDIIKPIYQTENQYSKHVSIFRTYQLPRMKGKYYAVCEGDDYWTDPYKLQKQYDAMENHPEVDICSHKALLVDSSDKSIISVSAPAQENCIIPVERVIEGGGGFVMTNSLFVRNRFDAENYPFRLNNTYDYSLQIAGSLRGGMLYLSDCMSAYRVLSQNSWVKTQAKDPKLRKQHMKKVQLMLNQLNIDTNNKYKKSINKVLRRNKYLYYARCIKNILR